MVTDLAAGNIKQFIQRESLIHGYVTMISIYFAIITSNGLVSHANANNSIKISFEISDIIAFMGVCRTYTSHIDIDIKLVVPMRTELIVFFFKFPNLKTILIP